MLYFSKPSATQTPQVYSLDAVHLTEVTLYKVQNKSIRGLVCYTDPLLSLSTYQ